MVTKGLGPGAGGAARRAFWDLCLLHAVQRTLSPCQHLSRCQGLGLQQRLGQWEFCSVLRDLAFRMTVNKNNGRFHSDTYKKKHCRRAGLP